MEVGRIHYLTYRKKNKIKLYNCKITHFLEDKVKLKKKSRRGTCYASRC